MKFAANSLIQWISIQDAINEKLENYDLGGLETKILINLRIVLREVKLTIKDLNMKVQY